MIRSDNTPCFNLGLEILLFDREIANPASDGVETVSISDSRFFSLIASARLSIYLFLHGFNLGLEILLFDREFHTNAPWHPS